MTDFVNTNRNKLTKKKFGFFYNNNNDDHILQTNNQTLKQKKVYIKNNTIQKLYLTDNL